MAFRLKRAKRVRVHMFDRPSIKVPSVEGLLVARIRSWFRHEYAIAVPRLLVNPEADPVELDSRLLVIPRENVLFYEYV